MAHKFEGNDAIDEGWTVLTESKWEITQIETLMNDLKTDIELDSTEEHAVCYNLLVLFNRKSTFKDQDLLYNCFQAFVKKIKLPSTVKQIVEELAQHYPSNRDENFSVRTLQILLRDIGKTKGLPEAVVDTTIPMLFSLLNMHNTSFIIPNFTIILGRFKRAIQKNSRYRAVAFYGEWLCTGKKLGGGSFGTVYLVKHTQSCLSAAMKVMNYEALIARQPMLKEKLKNEVELMFSMDHINIVKFYDHFRVDKYLILVMEYCAGGDLERYLRLKGTLSTEETQRWVQQLSQALKFLRQNNVIHRDLKLANVIIGAGDILKITDFTFARLLAPGELAKTVAGTPVYMAPEIIYRAQYSAKSDLWSVGVMIYQMLVGHFPFTPETLRKLFSNVEVNLRVNWTEAEMSGIAQEIRELVEGLLCVDTDVRMSWDEFFAHPFVSGTSSKRDADDENTGPAEVDWKRQARSLENTVATLQLQLQREKDKNKKLRAKLQRQK
eukprot:TRINITY_DN185_c0_g1_i1.p1 TRINITY_DN185_c0_g1~~TRINITY_DN185_c0_g1_i1.p1  ORF type:complete len:494 (+),score=77.30 TRINITY_DN185_c0_g1_i1:81-1562(+)